MWDVLALGAAAVDEICYVEHFPEPDIKLEVRATDREAGGLAVNVVVTVARMGLAAAYCGVLGNDDISRFARGALESEGVDCSPTAICDGARPFHSFVIVDETQRTRTVLYSGEGVSEPDLSVISDFLVRGCRVLFVDHSVPRAGLAAACIAREAGIPVVADIERAADPLVGKLIEEVDHLVIGIDYARGLTSRNEPMEIVRALAEGSRTAVVTNGENGSWWADAQGNSGHQPAFIVDVVDTLGCGDVYHGAYAASIASGATTAEAVRVASAAAALKATRRGVRAGIPRRGELERFLADHYQAIKEGRPPERSRRRVLGESGRSGIRTPFRRTPVRTLSGTRRRALRGRPRESRLA